MATLVIRTSDEKWVSKLHDAYSQRVPVTVVDDAKWGIDPTTQTILEMGRKAGLTYNEWVAVLVSLGISGAGVGMVVLAFLDPEPTTKLGLLVGGGVLCVLTGGFAAIRTLTNQKPPCVKVTPNGFELSW